MWARVRPARKITWQVAQPSRDHRGLSVEGLQKVKTLALSPCSAMLEHGLTGALFGRDGYALDAGPSARLRLQGYRCCRCFRFGLGRWKQAAHDEGY
jgi:hypothetical protein